MNFIPSFVSATSHYSIGFSAYTAVGIALMIAAVTFRVLALLPDRIEKIRKIIGPIILVSYVFLTGATVPPYINETSKTHEMSRVEGVRLIEQINFLAETGAVPLITPYFPNFQLPGQEGLGKSRLEKEISSPQGQANGIFLMIDHGWYSRFLKDEPTGYDLLDGHENWLENKQLFERLFEMNTIGGVVFGKIYSKGSSQIWATEELAEKFKKEF